MKVFSALKVIVLLLLFTQMNAHAAEPIHIMISDDIKKDAVTSISNIPQDVMNMLINKGYWRDEPCRLRFISYDSGGRLLSSWIAGVFSDNNSSIPKNWATYRATYRDGRNYLIGSYHTYAMHADNRRLAMDLICTSR